MKKYLSIILAVLLVLTSVSAFSISAEAENEELFGLPEIKEGYNRYFFLMPEDWVWDESVTAGIYWDKGKEAPNNWPGYKAHKADAENIYYYDVPEDVENIIWNNFYESADITSSVTRYNKRTDYIPTMDAEHKIIYDRMISVVNKSIYDNDELSETYPTCKWYNYYGNGEYGTKTTPEDAETYRYYFYLPEKWDNEHTEGVYALWWSESHPSSGYPGDKAKKTYINGLYYIDLPKDVEVIVWNNAVGEVSLDYTFGCSADPFANRNKVFVVDFDKSTTPQVTYFGDWYYYYGNGEYGLTENKTEEFYTHRSFGGDNPAPKLSTNRYYFYAPNDWENKFSKDVGIYWWEGTNNCEFLYLGYKAKKADIDGIFYYDVPTDVTSIIWNNFIDSGTDYDSEVYKSARQSANIGTEYYEPNESEVYPEGLESFDNMVYVLDYDTIDYNSFIPQYPVHGEWYYYYGNGEYGTTPEKGDVVYTQRYFGTAPENLPEPTKPFEPVVDEITVYFINTIGWENVYIHHHTNFGFGESNSEEGEAMHLLGTSDKGSVYSYNIPEDTSWIVFSNGTDKSHDISVNINHNSAFELTEKLDGKYLYNTYQLNDKGTILGDVNLDGKINIKDATTIQKHLANIEAIEGLGKTAADFNQDGRITIQDATAIQKHIAKL